MSTTREDEGEYIIVDRHQKCYAWFQDSEQQGNWLGYTDEAEPDRVAKEFDATIREGKPQQ